MTNANKVTGYDLTEREREEVVFAQGGDHTAVEDNRIGAALARKGLAERYSYYEPECSSLGQWGGTIIEYNLTAKGVRLRDLLWAADGHVYNPCNGTVTYNREEA